MVGFIQLTFAHENQYYEDCPSRCGAHQHDCLSRDEDPECDNIPKCILCGSKVY